MDFLVHFLDFRPKPLFAEIRLYDEIQKMAVFVIGIEGIESQSRLDVMIASFKKVRLLLRRFRAQEEGAILFHMGIEKKGNLQDFVLPVVLDEEGVGLVLDGGEDDVLIASPEVFLLQEPARDNLLVDPPFGREDLREALEEPIQKDRIPIKVSDGIVGGEDGIA